MARECDLSVITELIGDRARSQIQLFGFPVLQSVLWLTLLLDDYYFLLMSFLYFPGFSFVFGVICVSEWLYRQ